MSKKRNNPKPNFSDLYEDVGYLKGKVEGMDKKLDTVIESHGKRIDTLEDKVSYIKGKAAGAGFIAGFIVSVISILISFFSFFNKKQ